MWNRIVAGFVAGGFVLAGAAILCKVHKSAGFQQASQQTTSRNA